MRTEARQQWIERIIRNEVLVCQSMLVDKLLENGIVYYEEIENYYVDNSDEIEEIEEEIEALEEKIDKLQDEYDDLDYDYSEVDIDDEESEMIIREKMEDIEQQQRELQEEIEDLESKKEDLEYEENDPQEIYEWWVVSNWLADHLQSLGQPILRSDYETWWGRCTTGQSISLDYIMDRLYEKFHDENDNFII